MPPEAVTVIRIIPRATLTPILAVEGTPVASVQVAAMVVMEEEQEVVVVVEDVEEVEEEEEEDAEGEDVETAV
jgi:hypothetical protein